MRDLRPVERLEDGFWWLWSFAGSPRLVGLLRAETRGSFRVRQLRLPGTGLVAEDPGAFWHGQALALEPADAYDWCLAELGERLRAPEPPEVAGG